jgi:hypothetical protein
MVTGRVFRYFCWRPVIAGGLLCGLLTACAATMQSTPVEVAGVAPNEGIVVGSVLIDTEETPKDESALAFLGGQKTSRLTYAASIERADRGPIREFFQQDEYILGGIKPNEERVFVKTLPAGDYRIYSIEATNFLVQLQYEPSVFFAVESGGKSYIGKFIFQLPDRVRGGSGARFRVDNDQDRTLAALEKEYAQSLTGVTRSLMTIGGRRLVPGDTQASARLQQDVLNVMMAMDKPEEPQCAERKIIDTTAISDSEERWTLDRCGTPVPYHVTYRPDPDGGTLFSVKEEK